MKNIIFIFLLAGLLTLMGCGQEKEELIGGQKDENGCLTAAGYQWCPSQQKCMRMWEEYCTEYAEQYRGELEQPKQENTACLEYCEQQPHIMCVGHWEITGEYPDCECKFVCETGEGAV